MPATRATWEERAAWLWIPEMGGLDEAVILFLRMGVVALLYLFLIILLLIVQRDLAQNPSGGRSSEPVERLIVMDPGTSAAEPGEAIRLRSLTVLGRGPESSVILEDDFVSAVHAAVFLRDGQWWVRDEGSTNGTLLNGRPVPVETPIRTGDEIQIGQVRLQVAL